MDAQVSADSDDSDALTRSTTPIADIVDQIMRPDMVAITNPKPAEQKPACN